MAAEEFRWKCGTIPPTEEVTDKYKLSSEEAPRLSEVREDIVLPVIDISEENEEALADKLANASEELGFFRIINHGVSEEVWRNAAVSLRDFFLLSPEIKSKFPGEEGPIDSVKLFSYFQNDWDDRRKVSVYSEAINHLWHPTSDYYIEAFPDEVPVTYREHVAACAKEMGFLMTRLLSLLSKGLGLEDPDYLKKSLGDQPLYKCTGNYYPRSPDPDLTIGLPMHSDSLALTVVRSLDDISGLQIRKSNEEWVAVHQLPNSFIVNIGDQLEVLSNGRYKSVFHRVVNNKSSSRVSLAYFWGPSLDTRIGPIAELVDEQHPPVYKDYIYKDFIKQYNKMKGRRRAVKELYRIDRPIS